MKKKTLLLTLLVSLLATLFIAPTLGLRPLHPGESLLPLSGFHMIPARSLSRRVNRLCSL